MRNKDDLEKELLEYEKQNTGKPDRKGKAGKLALNASLLIFSAIVIIVYAVRTVRRLANTAVTVSGYSVSDKLIFGAFLGGILLLSAVMYNLTKPKDKKGFDSNRLRLCITAVVGTVMIAGFIILCVKTI